MEKILSLIMMILNDNLNFKPRLHKTQRKKNDLKYIKLHIDS